MIARSLSSKSTTKNLGHLAAGYFWRRKKTLTPLSSLKGTVTGSSVKTSSWRREACWSGNPRPSYLTRTATQCSGPHQRKMAVCARALVCGVGERQKRWERARGLPQCRRTSAPQESAVSRARPLSRYFRAIAPVERDEGDCCETGSMRRGDAAEGKRKGEGG